MHATRFSSHSTGARRYPLSYVMSGRYHWDTSLGSLGGQDGFGLWWTTLLEVVMYIDPGNVTTDYHYGRDGGLSLCRRRAAPSVLAFDPWGLFSPLLVMRRR